MRARGYRMGRDVVVRCRQGHMYTTIWLPGGSLKSLRFGLRRLRRRPWRRGEAGRSAGVRRAPPVVDLGVALPTIELAGQLKIAAKFGLDAGIVARLRGNRSSLRSGGMGKRLFIGIVFATAQALVGYVPPRRPHGDSRPYATPSDRSSTTASSPRRQSRAAA